MVITTPGKVTDRIVLLGRNESSVYILKGNNEYALIGGGMVHIVPEVLEQLKAFEIEEEKIRRILILHSHFDHCGIVPFFKKRWPRATVTASATSKDLLVLPKLIAAVKAMNRDVLEKHGRLKQGEELELDFPGIEVEETVKDGDRLSCGDLTMEILDVPGHSSCSIAVYVPEEKAMFASDAGGIPFGDDVFAAANSDFDKYQNSLMKMAGYDIEVHLAEHYGARTGEQGRDFLKKAIAAAEYSRKILEESLTRTRDIKASTREITEKVMAAAPSDFLAEEVISMVVGQMLKYLSKQRAA